MIFTPLRTGKSPKAWMQLIANSKLGHGMTYVWHIGATWDPLGYPAYATPWYTMIHHTKTPRPWPETCTKQPARRRPCHPPYPSHGHPWKRQGGFCMILCLVKNTKTTLRISVRYLKQIQVSISSSSSPMKETSAAAAAETSFSMGKRHLVLPHLKVESNERRPGGPVDRQCCSAMNEWHLQFWEWLK